MDLLPNAFRVECSEVYDPGWPRFRGTSEEEKGKMTKGYREGIMPVEELRGLLRKCHC